MCRIHQAIVNGRENRAREKLSVDKAVQLLQDQNSFITHLKNRLKELIKNVVVDVFCGSIYKFSVHDMHQSVLVELQDSICIPTNKKPRYSKLLEKLNKCKDTSNLFDECFREAMRLIEGSKEATTNYILDGSGIKLAPDQTNEKGCFIDHVISAAKGELGNQYKRQLFGKERKTRSSKSNKNSKEEQVGTMSERDPYNINFRCLSPSYNSDFTPPTSEEDITGDVFNVESSPNNVLNGNSDTSSNPIANNLLLFATAADRLKPIPETEGPVEKTDCTENLAQTNLQLDAAIKLNSIAAGRTFDGKEGPVEKTVRTDNVSQSPSKLYNRRKEDCEQQISQKRKADQEEISNDCQRRKFEQEPIMEGCVHVTQECATNVGVNTTSNHSKKNDLVVKQSKGKELRRLQVVQKESSSVQLTGSKKFVLVVGMSPIVGMVKRY